MSLADRELLSSHAGYRGGPAIQIEKNKIGTLAAQSGAPKLPRACPLAWDSANSLWTVYTQPSATVASFTLTRDAGAGDGGEFDLFIDGLGINLDWDASTAEVLAGINDVLADAGKDYTVTVVNSGSGTDLGTSGNIQTVTFSEGADAPSITADMSGLTDGGLNEPTGIALAIVAAGTDLNGTDKIRGFIDDDGGVDSNATNEVQILVALQGDLSRNAINTAAIRAVLGGAPTEGELDSALQDPDLRSLGFQIKDLGGVN